MSHPIVHCRGNTMTKRFSILLNETVLEVLRIPLSPMEKVLATAVAEFLIDGRPVEIDIEKEVKRILKDIKNENNEQRPVRT